MADATTDLRLMSGNGPVSRKVLRTPLRDASPDEIPIIDIGPMFSSSLDERQYVARQIRDAAMNNGFFYITNHGVPNTVTNDAYASCLEFFRQPLQTKMKADQKKSTYFNGYNPPRNQQINPNESVDIRETFSWTYDPRFDPLIVSDLSQMPEKAKKNIHPEDFPWEATSHLPQFKESIVKYFENCLMIARGLTRSFALSLDLPEDFFDSKVKIPDASFAFNYYPPIPKPSEPDDSELQVSIGSHTDFQLFTILWQDDAGGLQVLNRKGQWINAKPIPGTFVVNIADYLQRITNDRYVSTVHRAQNWSGRERISMPFFWGFGLHESCGVLETCVGPEGTKYEEINCEEWVRRRVKDMLKVSKLKV
ncbi:Fc.00g103810.m01.CDS01 [Cosmosporella sp. VM-42]